MMKSSNEGSQLLKFHGRTWKSFEWKPLLNWECLKLNLNRIQFEHECLLLWLYYKNPKRVKSSLKISSKNLKNRWMKASLSWKVMEANRINCNLTLYTHMLWWVISSLLEMGLHSLKWNFRRARDWLMHQTWMSNVAVTKLMSHKILTWCIQQSQLQVIYLVATQIFSSLH